ncbi:hypothetical protein PBAT_02230 [Paenibacillus antarcticus]|uniref:Uncharacterized protein n=1 Tax=Paenibacillus antarcticus TaxID=253703 RepID=A0A168R1L8_9BACL|nr:hypothetical protein PBAT_02230 [Paenibacillus antarcticus]
MKGDILFRCVDKHRFIVSREDIRIGVDGLACIECGKWCYAIGSADLYLNEGVKRYTRSKTKDPLLTITVQDIDSVPVVTYKGEDIQGKVSISYEWLTRDDTGDGIHNACIKHIDKYVGSIGEITFNREVTK